MVLYSSPLPFTRSRSCSFSKSAKSSSSLPSPQIEFEWELELDCECALELSLRFFKFLGRVRSFAVDGIATRAAGIEKLGARVLGGLDLASEEAVGAVSLD